MSDEYEGYLRWKVSAQQQIDWYREEVRELKAERERMLKANVEKNNEVLRLLAENAKLRELVKDMLPFLSDDIGICVGGDCFAIWECCESESSDGEECPAMRRMRERARELGVEA